MSADDDDGPGNREVAHRVFAAEYEDADFSWKESDEERAPTYVITPSGAKVNRMFLVGVLTEVEQVNEDMLRGRIVDPTGAFVVYAGQYQPDARAFFERADPPAFVAVTGKARTFQPEDSDRVFTSVRPESVNEVDADTRDRWTVTTAEATLSRVGTMAKAIRGEVTPAETTGPALAADHYDTSPAYLSALRDLALSAARVVAGERDEVEPLTADPDAPGQADTGDLAALADASAVEAVAAAEGEATTGTGEPADEAAAETAGSPNDGADAAAADDDAPTATEGTEPATASAGDGPSTGATSAAEGGTTEAADGTEQETTGSVESAGGSDDVGEFESGDSDESIGDFDSGGDLRDFDADEGATADGTEPDEPTDDRAASGDATGDAGEPEADAEEDAEEPAAATNGDAEVSGQPDEMYELDEDERREIEEEYDTEFSTGTEVDSPGEAEIDTPEPDEAEQPEAEPGEEEPTGADDAEADEKATAEVDDEPEDETGEVEQPEAETEVDEEEPTDADEEPEPDADEGAEPEADLDEVLMETMRDLDEGDGANRSELVDRVTDATGASPEDVEDAIQDALMGGQCYEPDDETLKPI